MKSRSLILAIALTIVSATLAAASGPLGTDFEKGIPPGWKSAGMGPEQDRGQAQTVQGVGGNHFLRISTDGSFYSIGIDTAFSPQQFPILSWRWRVAGLPKGADISKKNADDAAARLFVTFSNADPRPKSRSRALIYVWDTKYPVGTIVASPFFPRTEKAIVLESGPARIGRWVPERVNLVNDYRRAFGGSPPAVKSIVCATDSDQTKTPTSADFDDLQVTAHPEAVKK
jgi:Protein of unknown function (DUF3047)